MGDILYICDAANDCKKYNCSHFKPHKYVKWSCDYYNCHIINKRVKCIPVITEEFITEEEFMI